MLKSFLMESPHHPPTPRVTLGNILCALIAPCPSCIMDGSYSALSLSPTWVTQMSPRCLLLFWDVGKIESNLLIQWPEGIQSLHRESANISYYPQGIWGEERGHGKMLFSESPEFRAGKENGDKTILLYMDLNWKLTKGLCFNETAMETIVTLYKHSGVHYATGDCEGEWVMEEDLSQHPLPSLMLLSLLFLLITFLSACQGSLNYLPQWSRALFFLWIFGTNHHWDTCLHLLISH